MRYIYDTAPEVADEVSAIKLQVIYALGTLRAVYLAGSESKPSKRLKQIGKYYLQVSFSVAFVYDIRQYLTEAFIYL